MFFPSFPINTFAYEIAIFITIAVLLDGTYGHGHGHGHMEVGFTTTYAITTDVVSSTLDK